MPRYSKKHYKDMAAILCKAKISLRCSGGFNPQLEARHDTVIVDAGIYVINLIAYKMARLFQADDSRFDRKRFYEAVNKH